MREADARIDSDVYEALALETVVAGRTSFGGTAPDQVRERIAAARARLAEEEA
jgi:argininosuccinate lyase